GRDHGARDAARDLGVDARGGVAAFCAEVTRRFVTVPIRTTGDRRVWRELGDRRATLRPWSSRRAGEVSRFGWPCGRRGTVLIVSEFRGASGPRGRSGLAPQLLDRADNHRSIW